MIDLVVWGSLHIGGSLFIFFSVVLAWLWVHCTYYWFPCYIASAAILQLYAESERSSGPWIGVTNCAGAFLASGIVHRHVGYWRGISGRQRVLDFQCDNKESALVSVRTRGVYSEFQV